MILHKIIHFLIQLIRRCIQGAVVLGLLGLIYISLYSHYRAARALEDVEGYNAGIFSKIDEYVNETKDPQDFLDSYKGTIWSMRIAGVDITDPLAAAETIAASRSIYRCYFPFYFPS